MGKAGEGSQAKRIKVQCETPFWVMASKGVYSRKSHAELDESTELDAGDVEEFGALFAVLLERTMPWLRVVGGCCGTDHRHVEETCKACAA